MGTRREGCSRSRNASRNATRLSALPSCPHLRAVSPFAADPSRNITRLSALPSCPLAMPWPFRHASRLAERGAPGGISYGRSRQPKGERRRPPRRAHQARGRTSRWRRTSLLLSSCERRKQADNRRQRPSLRSPARRTAPARRVGTPRPPRFNQPPPPPSAFETHRALASIPPPVIAAIASPVGISVSRRRPCVLWTAPPPWRLRASGAAGGAGAGRRARDDRGTCGGPAC